MTHDDATDTLDAAPGSSGHVKPPAPAPAPAPGPAPADAPSSTVASTAVVAAFMLVAGAANTILAKLQDRQCVGNCGTPDQRDFEQPVWQTANMFAGEWLCLIVWHTVQAARGCGARYMYRASYVPAPEDDEVVDGDLDDSDRLLEKTVDLEPKEELEGWKVALLMVPTTCDIIGTTVGFLNAIASRFRFPTNFSTRHPFNPSMLPQLMNVALLLTTASIYQILRGSIVLVTGLLSFLFLHRRFHKFQWIALIVVTLGIAIVGASPLLQGELLIPLESSSDAQRMILGSALILVAQLFTATQYILEERLLSKYNLHPLRAIGLEGMFGLLFLILAMPPLYFAVGRTEGSWFNIPEAWAQITSNPTIYISALGSILSIAVFNATGLEVTRRMSATSRSTIDACRTILIWAVSLGLGWEQLIALQVVGFIGA